MLIRQENHGSQILLSNPPVSRPIENDSPVSVCVDIRPILIVDPVGMYYRSEEPELDVTVVNA